jgi:hypothetical protein
MQAICKNYKSLFAMSNNSSTKEIIAKISSYIKKLECRVFCRKAQRTNTPS